MTRGRTQASVRRRDGRGSGAVTVEDGCVNYLFPFSFQAHRVARDIRDHPGRLAEPSRYRTQILDAIRVLSHEIPNIEEGLTWLPSPGWQFGPHRFSLAGQPRDDPDMAAFVASDGFFFLSEYLRRQPLVRLRLSNSFTIERATGEPLVEGVHMDLALHMALGQGCLAFRHPIRELSVDDVIGIRLTQFRRGMSVLWRENEPNPAGPRELQNVYLDCGRRLFGPAFVPTYDVRQYAAVLEVRRVRGPDGRAVEFEEIRDSAPKWLYGLLHVDERWRDIDPGKAAEGLSQAVCHSSRYRQYCQSVSLLIVNSAEPDGGNGAVQERNVLDDYYWNLRSNAGRSVADRSCVMEAVMAQENLLVCLYEDYRKLVSARTPSRSAAQRLRRDLVVSREEADESFNIVPGEELLMSVRGMGRWRQRTQEASAILETVLGDYREYNSDLLKDLAFAWTVAVGVSSIMFSFGTAIGVATRSGLTAGLAVLAVTRCYKYSDRVAAALTIASIVAIVLLWLVPAIWEGARP